MNCLDAGFKKSNLFLPFIMFQQMPDYVIHGLSSAVLVVLKSKLLLQLK